MKLYSVFAYRGESWDDVNERICISQAFPTLKSANNHANELKEMFGCNTEIVERDWK